MVAYSFNKMFREPILSGRKAHTLRAPRKHHARIGDPVHLYTGMRTRSCLIIGWSQCDRTAIVKLSFRARTVFLDDKPVDDLEAFAWSDGFESFAAMAAFWRGTHGITETWSGHLIGWSYPIATTTEAGASVRQ